MLSQASPSVDLSAILNKPSLDQRLTAMINELGGVLTPSPLYGKNLDDMAERALTLIGVECELTPVQAVLRDVLEVKVLGAERASPAAQKLAEAGHALYAGRLRSEGAPDLRQILLSRNLSPADVKTITPMVTALYFCTEAHGTLSGKMGRELQRLAPLGPMPTPYKSQQSPALATGWGAGIRASL